MSKVRATAHDEYVLGKVAIPSFGKGGGSLDGLGLAGFIS